MKLDRLVLINWGQLRPGNYDMGDMTLLTGETGAGKSTMLDSLQTVMTAAYKGILNYNPGQEEVSQGQRRGKTKRSLESYVVGAEYSLFSCPHGAQGFVAAVFRPGKGEEHLKPFTALMAAAARVDGAGDNRQALVALLLEEAQCPFAESPIQLQVCLPTSPLVGVLFVENLMSFEQALRSASPELTGLALVFASGFKGSATRLRTREGASLYYSDRGPMGGETKDGFERWLFSEQGSVPAYFWGDLDWAGMRILLALRRSFPDVAAWQPGYAPMLASLQDGQGHFPEDADKQGQLALPVCGCDYADRVLIPAMAASGRFVDQELFTLLA